jgi:uncharacterized tellurite resistance protein B-like protein
MATNSSVQTLVKILIGTAWLDGKIQPQEREYLHRIAQEKAVAEDPAIQPLLYELRAVKPEECYAWVQDYLGDHPTSQDCHQLIEEISGLIYSDGTVASEEAKLLTRLQMIDTTSDSPNYYTNLLNVIRQLYQRGCQQFNS